jgi:hypothetical protein
MVDVEVVKVRVEVEVAEQAFRALVTLVLSWKVREPLAVAIGALRPRFHDLWAGRHSFAD